MKSTSYDDGRKALVLTTDCTGRMALNNKTKQHFPNMCHATLSTVDQLLKYVCESLALKLCSRLGLVNYFGTTLGVQAVGCLCPIETYIELYIIISIILKLHLYSDLHDVYYNTS